MFRATNPQAPLLLTVNPSALFFNQLNPGAIASQAVLGVEPEQRLVLVGGDIGLDKSVMVAPRGQIELAAIAGSGTVGLKSSKHKAGAEPATAILCCLPLRLKQHGLLALLRLVQNHERNKK